LGHRTRSPHASSTINDDSLRAYVQVITTSRVDYDNGPRLRGFTRPPPTCALIGSVSDLSRGASAVEVGEHSEHPPVAAAGRDQPEPGEDVADVPGARRCH
jgi:hypothetical protein